MLLKLERCNAFKKLNVSAGMKKNAILVVLVFVLFASCKKQNSYPVITGMVQQPGGCLPDTWLVFIPGGDGDKHSFLCPSSTPTSSLNCSNSVYIVNMPASLAQFGTRVKFSRWRDMGGACASSTFAPHHLEVSDLTAE